MQVGGGVGLTEKGSHLKFQLRGEGFLEREAF